MITPHVTITQSVPAVQRPTASIVAHRINHLSDVLEVEITLLESFRRLGQLDNVRRMEAEVAISQRQLQALRRRYSFISTAA